MKGKMILLHAIFAVLGGLLYAGVEILFRGFTDWRMVIVGGICFLLIGLLDEVFPEMPILMQMTLSALIVTIIELIAGLILNVWLGLGIWDYSNMPYNLFGQVCLPFSLIWFALSYPAIQLENWMHTLSDRITA